MKTRYLILLAAGLLFGACSAAFAQSAAPRIVTLDECRDLAVKNNASVKIAKGNADAAEEVRKEAFTKYFPTIEASALGFRSNKPVFHYEVLDLLTIEFLRKGQGASVYAVQPIFAGGRIVNGNKLAAVGAEAGRLQHQGAIDDAKLKAEQYYWQLATLKSKKRTLQAVILMTDTLVSHVQVAVNAGVTLRNDLLKAQLADNELRTIMVDLDNGISLSSQLLAQYIGLDGQPIDIPDDIIPCDEMPIFPADLFVEADRALPATTDYQLLEQQVKAASLERRIAVGNNLPVVGLGAGYFYDDLLNEKYSFGAVFLSVTVPISSWWGGSHAIKKSKIAEANAREQMTDLSQMLKIKMSDAWDNLTAAYRKMQIAHESIAQADENLRLNQNYYNAGTTTITDLLEAQALYRQAHDAMAESYAAYRLSQAQYLDATGQAID